MSVCLLFSEGTEEKSKGFSNKRFRKSFTSLTSRFQRGGWGGGHSPPSSFTVPSFFYSQTDRTIYTLGICLFFSFFSVSHSSYTFLYFSFPGSCGREGERRSLAQHLHAVSSQFSHQQSNHLIPPTTSSAQCLYLEPQR